MNFSCKSQQVTTERLLLADPSTGGISTTLNQAVLYSIGEICYHNLARHLKEFIV
jgi:hypothetical protein